VKTPLILTFALGLLAATSTPTLAQPKAHRYKKDTDAPKVQVIKRRGRTVFRFTKGIVLYGRHHKPQAVLVIDRKQDLFRMAAPRKELSSRILDPVRRRPF
jgi:hypothetical protein